MGKKKNSHKGNNITQTAFKFIRIGALLAPAADELIFGADTPQGRIKHTIRKYTGYDAYNKRMDWGSLVEGWGPYLGAIITTHGIPKITKIIRSLF